MANHDAVCGPQQKSKDTGADEDSVFPSGAVENFMSDEISWDDQRVFLAVLEAGSFAAAARKLAVSHPTVRSRIEVLESALGAVLFVRSTTGLIPTELAESLRRPVTAMAHASHSFRREAASSGGVSGVVRMSVPEIMGTEVLPKMLADLRIEHPDLRIELVLSDVSADLLTREVDLAIRTYTPTQGALVARKAANIPLGLYASTSYVHRHGVPKNLMELGDHDLIGPDRNRADWALAVSLGLTSTSSNFVFKSDSHPAQVAALRQGIGIGVLQTPLGETDPNLIRILPDVDIHKLDVWIVAHENLLKVGRIRAAFDHFVKSFQRYQLLGRPASRPSANPFIAADIIGHDAAASLSVPEEL
ncbi:LysR family transcriptional regulator [Rhizobium sp. Leaf262]|uniref:LysR family transcriptional regulator n=1 Tax=Rhizobium sp. Leaf262 TaxID=1736312 RepID=UPI001FCD9874|nr:LysR family transcriptional regulator [Rhizobium sp. Leaf262]